jgi:hypothetical protein
LVNGEEAMDDELERLLESERPEVAQAARLELAKACLEAASQLVILATELVRRAEHEAHKDLAIKVETWLAALSQRARALHKQA